EPESSNALRMAATTNSALASAPEAISPLISTTAVWGEVLVFVAVSLKNTIHSASNTTTDHSKRLKNLQRRAARCSLIEAKTSFSSTSRSQPPLPDALGVADASADAADALDHRSAPGVTCDCELWLSGVFGELISKL